MPLGDFVGIAVGCTLGASVGVGVGCFVGSVVGVAVRGASVGGGVYMRFAHNSVPEKHNPVPTTNPVHCPLRVPDVNWQVHTGCPRPPHCESTVHP